MPWSARSRESGVGALVGALPGERVLDLAAAPGGKATHLAARMRNVGLLVANDVSRSRALDLVGNVERCGIRSALVTAEAPDRLADRFGAWFDRVLVDAPCSGESMFHKSPAARADWNPAAVQGCARRQADLIRTAARLVRPGGILVYSTCTFSREENEDLIAAFLEEAPDFLPGELEPVPGATPAAIGPAVDGSASATPAAYRLWPHRFPGAGHFVASLRRNEARAGSPARPSRSAGTGRSATAPEVRMVEDFLDVVFPDHDIDLGRVTMRGRKLYERPDPCPDLDGVDVLRPGLELGTVYPRRFEPSHALALAFGADRSPGSVRLSPHDVRLDRFLRGHPIDDPGPAGWVPVAVDGFSLGWGKRVGGVVKNHYPKGLRLHG